MTDYRLIFSKMGPLVFISHLDLTHAFVRAFGRAGLRFRYTEGFHPHPKIVFALPLPVGMAGENELVDIGLAQDLPPAMLLDALCPALPRDITVKKIIPPEPKLKEIKSASYAVKFEGPVNETLRLLIKQTLALQELVVEKRTKSGGQAYDISPSLLSASFRDTDQTLRLTLDATSDGYLNPEYVMKALQDRGFPSDLPYRITREQILF